MQQFTCGGITVTQGITITWCLSYSTFFYFGKTFDYDNDFLLLIIGISSIVFGIILLIVDKFCLLIRNEESMNYKLALFTGFFQCFALIPGVSRAGANMIVSGSGIFKADDMAFNVSTMRRSLEKYGNGWEDNKLSPIKYSKNNL